MRQEHRQLDQGNGGGSLEDKAPDESTGGRNGVVVLIPVGFWWEAPGHSQASILPRHSILRERRPWERTQNPAQQYQLHQVPGRTGGGKIWIPFWKLVQLISRHTGKAS